MSSRPAWLLLAVVAWPACEEESALARLGEGCTLSSDCDGGLECLFGTCHEGCATSEDCPVGRCVMGPDRVKICQPEVTNPCVFSSECPSPLACAIDGRCRNECESDRDCVPGQVCVSATCAEQEELSDGRLPAAPGTQPLGKPCRYSSDCMPGEGGLVLECKNGVCAYACFEERDCPRFFRCSTASDPSAPGNCELIGEAGKLYCDPDDQPAGYPCDCLITGPGSGKQTCRPDGSGYEACSCN